MTKSTTGTRIAPLSLRLSREERALLEVAANGLPLSTYIKTRLLDGRAVAPARRRRNPLKDTKALAQALACLGGSRLPETVGELAAAARSGSLMMDWEVQAKIAGACNNIRAMRQLLMTALGVKMPDEPPAKMSTSQSFAIVGAEGTGW